MFSGRLETFSSNTSGFYRLIYRWNISTTASNRLGQWFSFDTLIAIIRFAVHAQHFTGTAHMCLLTFTQTSNENERKYKKFLLFAVSILSQCDLFTVPHQPKEFGSRQTKTTTTKLLSRKVNYKRKIIIQAKKTKKKKRRIAEKRYTTYGIRPR